MGKKQPERPPAGDDVIERLRVLANTPVGPPGRSATVLAAASGPRRRSDAEVARAVLGLEIALSSPAFRAVLDPDESGRAVVAASAPVSAASFCEVYHEVKDYIDITLEALDWLPVPYASTVQRVVRLLEKFADRACRS